MTVTSDPHQGPTGLPRGQGQGGGPTEQNLQAQTTEGLGLATAQTTTSAGDADAQLLDGQKPPSARVPLSRTRVLRAALKILDEQSLDALSMRSVASSLGVEAMSLYRYVRNRDDMLNGVVTLLTDELKGDSEVTLHPEHGWPDFLQRLAHGIRRIALAHPNVFPVLASRPPEAPWLRPPLRSLEWVNIFLTALREEGFTREQAAAAYRAYTSFLLGQLLLEAAQHSGSLSPAAAVMGDAEAAADTVDDQDMESPQDSDQVEELAPYPAVAEMGKLLAEDHSAAEFEETLESLVERISLMVQR